MLYLVYVCTCLWMCVLLQRMYGGQGIPSESQFSASTMCVPEMEIKQPGLAASTIAY